MPVDVIEEKVGLITVSFVDGSYRLQSVNKYRELFQAAIDWLELNLKFTLVDMSWKQEGNEWSITLYGYLPDGDS